MFVSALDDYEAILMSTIDLVKAAPDAGQGSFDAAKILARAASRIQADAKLNPSRKDELARKFLGRTVMMLREAIDANTQLAALIKNDPVFKELREHREFEIMLSSLVDVARGRAR